jgi:plasmid stabilization system protein ParE
VFGHQKQNPVSQTRFKREKPVMTDVESCMGSSIGRKGRHLVVFRMVDGQAIDVIRLLHDSMDLAKYLPE